MKYILITLTLITLFSCSVKNNEEQTNVETGTNEQKPVQSDDNQGIPTNDQDKDSDGDFMTDREEIDLGRNPLIADIPEIRKRFLQHYKIIVTYKDLKNGEIGSFSIDTKRISDDPSFKYRVGDIFFRKNSLKSAALIGRYSGHSHGEYQEHDFSWITYPEIDSRFFLEKTMRYRKYFDENKYLIENIRLEFENSLRLKANSTYQELSNPTLTFRFYNYESENYEVIHSETIERTFMQGVNEIISIKIDNVDHKLIKENFFQKGDFIISELTDYEIPSLETTYLNLKSSIKEKTIPIVYNTPLETSLRYVSVEDGKSFTEIMKTLFDDNYAVENERLVSIYQFRNSIPNYQYLDELRDMNKKGDWFVFTNSLNKHFIDHKYTKDDVISLSYVLGSQLATQEEEKIFSYRESITSSNSSKTYPIGNISNNSVISFILQPLNKVGQELIPGGGEYRNQGCGGRRNCVSFPFLCGIRIHGFKNFNKEYSFDQSFNNELSRIALKINQNEYKLKDLFEQKKIKVHFKDKYIVIVIDKVSSIQSINPIDENVAMIKAYGKSTTHFSGVKLEKAEGRGWYQCPNIVANLAHNNKLPVNTNSVRFGEWAHWYNWNVLSKSQNKTIYESFNFGMSSTIINKFN